MRSYPVLDPVSQAYPRVGGRSPTCYSPVRRSCTPKGLTARLACVKHAASVRPEPGSNSPTKTVRRETLSQQNNCTQRKPPPQKKVRGQSTQNVSTLLSSQRTTTRVSAAGFRAFLRGDSHRRRSSSGAIPGVNPLSGPSRRTTAETSAPTVGAAGASASSSSVADRPRE